MTTVSLRLDDLQALTAATDVLHIFDRLGYDPGEPQPFEGDALDEFGFDEADRRAVQRAYLVGERDSHSIYLFEVDDLSVIRLRGLAWNVLRRGSALLIVTRDYKELLFVDPRFAGSPTKSNVRVNKLKVVTRDATRHDLDTLNAIHAHRRTGDQIYAAQRDAFNVTTVTKRFYDEYRRFYERTIAAVKEHNKGVADFYDADKLHAFTQRLLGRLMFLYFLQRKGWLGGRGKFLTEMYRATQTKHAGELGDGETFYYYREVLEPLFFDTLNTRRPGGITQWEGIRIPYLNGGLFDRARDPQTTIILPDALFDPHQGDGLLHFFNRYNFTIADDTPLEQDVAVDPEMLGKVFENMLEERDRGQSGSFYTPRAIVAYMCQEALAGYLEERAEVPRELTRSLFDPDADAALTSEQAERANTALDTLTVLDPAVGSGSFLIGMMTEIIRLRRAAYYALTLNPSPKGEGLEDTPTFFPSPSGEGQGVRANPAFLSVSEGEGLTDTYREWAAQAIMQIARELRQRQTSAETILWEALRDRRLADLKFRRQHPVANTTYVVDFFCYERQLVIELDGGIHAQQRDADLQRQHDLEALGLRVLRFPNEAVYNDLEQVLVRISQAAFLPSPSGEGSGVRAEPSGEGSGVRAEPPAHVIAEWKARIIRDTLYGVDIKPEAVEIAQLRLWLALVVDQTLEDAHPLPNLDYKLMAGNSLIETIDGEPVLGAAADAMLQGDFTDAGAPVMPVQTHMFDPVQLSFDVSAAQAEVRQERAKLDRLRREYFDAPPERRKDLRAEITAQERQIVFASLREKADKLQAQIDHWGKQAGQRPLKAAETKKLNEAVSKLARLTKMQEELSKPEAALPFFLYRLHFSEVFARGGFDVVVANPPYVRGELIGDQKDELKIAPIYKEVYAGSADLYVYFFARAYDLLRQGGQLSFITSNKYLRANYGKGLRQFLSDNLRLRAIIDFGDLPVFDAAAYPCIVIGDKTALTLNPSPKGEGLDSPLLAQRSGEGQGVRAAAVKDMDSLEDLNGALARGVRLNKADLGAHEWQISDANVQNVFAKLKAAGTPLGKYVDGKIYYGIKTGFNDAFVIDEAKRAELIAADPKSAEIIKPWLRGRDVHRWTTDHSLYLIYIPWDFKPKQYPVIMKHLEKFRNELEDRPEVKEGRFPWYALSRYGSEYAHEFDNPKIVLPSIVNIASFAFDSTCAYSNDKTTIVVTDDLFVIGVLNSSTVNFVLHQIAPTKQNDYFEQKPVVVNQIPIPNPSADLRDKIAAKARACLDAAGKGNAGRVTALEAELNALVYQAYGLTEEEISVIEGAVGKV